MSSLIVIGNKNKITQTSGKEGSSNTFPKCEVKKSFWGGWKWKVELGDSKTEGRISSFSNHFSQSFNGVSITGNPSEYLKKMYHITIFYKDKVKVFSISDDEIVESKVTPQ